MPSRLGRCTSLARIGEPKVVKYYRLLSDREPRRGSGAERPSSSRQEHRRGAHRRRVGPERPPAGELQVR